MYKVLWLEARAVFEQGIFHLGHDISWPTIVPSSDMEYQLCFHVVINQSFLKWFNVGIIYMRPIVWESILLSKDQWSSPSGGKRNVEPIYDNEYSLNNGHALAL